MKSYLASILFLFALSPVVASADNAQGQTGIVQGESTAIISPGAVEINSYGAQDLPVKKVVNESTGTTTVKTTGQAIAPGIYNSSGQYTCFGGVSAGVGVPGVAVSGGVTVSQADCYRLHRMDKAAGRAGAAMKAAADPALPPTARTQFTAQGEAFSKLWDAEYCAMDGGADAFKKAGMECPDEPAKRAVSEGQAKQVMLRSTDPYIARRLGQ